MKFTLFFLLFTLSLSLHAKLIIISDLDDTVRKANVVQKTDAAARLARGVRPFVLLRDIYRDIKFRYKSNVQFHYLSASFKKLYNANKWLDEYDFPKGEVYQRRLRDLRGSARFKKKKLEEILKSASTQDEIVMIGDNGEHDPDVYSTLSKSRSDLNISIYIRDVTTLSLGLSQLSDQVRIEGIHYFLSEASLLETPLLESITLKRQLSICDNYHYEVPDFVRNRYIDRFIDHSCKDDEGKMDKSCRDEAYYLGLKNWGDYMSKTHSKSCQTLNINS